MKTFSQLFGTDLYLSYIYMEASKFVCAILVLCKMCSTSSLFSLGYLYVF